MVETYWDDWCWAEYAIPVLVPEPKDGNAVPRIMNSWGMPDDSDWPPMATAIATGGADDDPFRRLAAQIRGPGERLARQVLQR